MRALAALKAGDVLVVWKLDRLSRSLQDLIAILERLNACGIGFCSLSDGIDTATATGKLLFHVTGAVPEFERALISERTRAGMLAARRKGQLPGRPRRLEPAQVLAVRELARSQVPLASIARAMNVGKMTVWRAVSVRDAL